MKARQAAGRQRRIFLARKFIQKNQTDIFHHIPPSKSCNILYWTVLSCQGTAVAVSKFNFSIFNNKKLL